MFLTLPILTEENVGKSFFKVIRGGKKKKILNGEVLGEGEGKKVTTVSYNNDESGRNGYRALEAKRFGAELENMKKKL